MTQLAIVEAAQVFEAPENLESCSNLSTLHDNADPDVLKREALALLEEASAALAKWRNAIESQGVKYGELHSYPHHGRTRYNFYPSHKDKGTGKRKRSYVSQNQVRSYRADIARGKTCKEIRAIEDQVSALRQDVKAII